MISQGYVTGKLDLDGQWLSCIRDKDWESLDKLCFQQLAKEGQLHQALQEIRSFSETEHILSLRQFPDDEGIWHDDGSRLLAFSVSLNLDPQSIVAGELEMRRKEKREDVHILPNLPFGHYYIFATGQDNWEHRTQAVKSGERLVFAGWCS
ncbi:MAG: 2OG-Fe(II) oxygenase [Oligoflexia bacterium]|nr:2OG-Fe(II) oxygenase [Oligoflexia bacterium]